MERRVEGKNNQAATLHAKAIELHEYVYDENVTLPTQNNQAE